jgi:hypothetical protein
VWIDEYELLLDGADINAPIRNAIPDKAEFVIIYLSLDAMKPEWVRREYEWAREREKFRSNNA